MCAVSLSGSCLGGKDLAAHHIGQRDLGGGNQVQARVVFGAALDHAEQVVFELRQLAGAGHRLGVDHVGHVALGVAVLGGVHVEHELRERAMQPRHRAAQREARAGELGRGLEIQAAERFADVDVIARRNVERARRAPASHLDVVFFRLPDRNARVRRGWACPASTPATRPGCRRARAPARSAHRRSRRTSAISVGSVLALALAAPICLESAVALGLQLLGARLDGLALGLERARIYPGRERNRVAADAQRRRRRSLRSN